MPCATCQHPGDHGVCRPVTEVGESPFRPAVLDGRGPPAAAPGDGALAGRAARAPQEVCTLRPRTRVRVLVRPRTSSKARSLAVGASGMRAAPACPWVTFRFLPAAPQEWGFVHSPASSGAFKARGSEV